MGGGRGVARGFTPAGNFASRRSDEEHPAERHPRSRSHDDDCIEAETATIAMEREDQHQHEKEEICPRPFAWSAVEAEPQIEYLQRTDEAPEAHEDAENQ